MISKINVFTPKFGILTENAEREARSRFEKLIATQKNTPNIEIDYDNEFFRVYGIGSHSNDVRFLPWNTCDFTEACEIAQKYQNIING